MPADPKETKISFSEDDAGHPVIVAGSQQVATLADLVTQAPHLRNGENLDLYCEAVNHLKFGTEYRVITDPDGYRAKYDAKYESEDPNAPFQEGVIRLRDFGRCDTSEIDRPEIVGETVIFFVEDAALGIPYRVTAPAPAEQGTDAVYEPLPTTAEE